MFFFFDKRLKDVWGKDDRAVTLIYKKILQEKPILRKLWTVRYKQIISFLKPCSATLDIGSGAGFFKTLYPQVISSDILHLPDLDLVFDSMKIPLRNESIGNIVVKGVLHHLHDPFSFFKECDRVLEKGGRILINDPYITPVSYFIHKYIHFEHCDYSQKIKFKKGSPLGDCNTALATIIFKRRLQDFKREFPNFRIIHRDIHTFFIYVLTGGYSYPALIANRSFEFVMFIEKSLRFLRHIIGSYIFLVIEKK